LVCLGLCGCSCLWQDEREQVERTGHGVNLLPTAREDRAGER